MSLPSKEELGFDPAALKARCELSSSFHNDVRWCCVRAKLTTFVRLSASSPHCVHPPRSDNRERDARIRKDGNEQYIMIEGEYGNYLEDPYCTPVPREALVDSYSEIVLLGGGFATLIAAWKLREKGFRDIRVIENGGDFGGTCELFFWLGRLRERELGRDVALTRYSLSPAGYWNR